MTKSLVKGQNVAFTPNIFDELFNNTLHVYVIL